MRNESTLIMRNYAQERRPSRERIHASCPYRYSAHFRRFSPYGRPHHTNADAADCFFCSHHADADATDGFFRSHHSDADATIVT